jgi:putative transposase
MREPYTRLFVHFVWATWDRAPLITEELRPAIYACIQAECTGLKMEVIAIGGIEDHVHILARIPTTVALAEIVKQMKGSSSHLVTHRLPDPDGFKWQGAYSAFTVSEHDVPRVRDYILNQAEHHRDRSLDPCLELP